MCVGGDAVCDAVLWWMLSWQCPLTIFPSTLSHITHTHHIHTYTHTHTHKTHPQQEKRAKDFLKKGHEFLKGIGGPDKANFFTMEGACSG
jgi:hypothetical protein